MVIARLIALDWGSTQLRAWLLGEGGAVIDERRSPDGASQLSGGAAAFEAALQALAADWLALRVPAIACGMVGSAHGWIEAPYVDCPASLERLHEHLGVVRTRDGIAVRIVPGLIDAPRAGFPDVMRGEETQLAGLLALEPMLAAACTVLMPGTHSKWVDVRDGSVTRFRTRMTGELYALLRRHSVLARLMPPEGEDAPSAHDEAFDAGVEAARAAEGHDLAAQLFSVRTLGLTGRWPAAALPRYLSGLLIGHELVAGLASCTGPLALVGEPALCDHYARGLQRFAIAPASVHMNTARAGLWQLASRTTEGRQ